MTDQEYKLPFRTRAKGHLVNQVHRVWGHLIDNILKYIYIIGVFFFLTELPSGIKLETFISATIRTEYVELQIPRSSSFDIELPAAAVVAGGTGCDDTITIHIPPDAGARVFYQRVIGDNLYIRVVGRYGWSFKDGPLQVGDNKTKFILGRNGKRNECGWPEHVRLPIYGRMIAGLESGGAEQGPSFPILSGQLHIFTKIIDRLWKKDISQWAFMSSGLYEADSIPIGAGSQLFDANADADPADNARIWRGFADIDFSNTLNTERGMLIEASSSANGVKLVSPVGAVNGSFAQNKQQDVVSLSTFETIIKDPNIRVLLVFLGIPLAVLEVLTKIREGFTSKKKPAPHHPVEKEGIRK